MSNHHSPTVPWWHFSNRVFRLHRIAYRERKSNNYPHTPSRAEKTISWRGGFLEGIVSRFVCTHPRCGLEGGRGWNFSKQLKPFANGWLDENLVPFSFQRQLVADLDGTAQTLPLDLIYSPCDRIKTRARGLLRCHARKQPYDMGENCFIDKIQSERVFLAALMFRASVGSRGKIEPREKSSRAGVEEKWTRLELSRFNRGAHELPELLSGRNER